MYSLMILIAVILSVFAYCNEAEIKRLRDTIEKLEGEKSWITNNAIDIINLVNKSEVILTIETPDKMFGWLYKLRKYIGTQMVQTAFISNYKITPVKKVERAIKYMAEYVKKEAKKKKKGVRMLKLILKGRPITKKNSQIPIKTKSGKFFIIQSKQYRAYEKDCLFQIITQRIMKQPLVGNLHLRAWYYMPDRRRPDLLNLLQATADIVEKAKVIENDKDIVSFDLSKIMGVDKENPRVEIEITELKEILP